jgi:ADP-ribose pyrophosphatase YjhB (NUDIX family)
MLSREHGVCVLVMKEDKVFLIEEARETFNGHWAPPHGHCEPTDENEEASVVREMKEETNWDVKPLRMLWKTESSHTDAKSVAFWLAELLSEEESLRVDPKEAVGYGWFSVDEALELQLFPKTQVLFERIKEGLITL